MAKFNSVEVSENGTISGTLEKKLNIKIGNTTYQYDASEDKTITITTESEKKTLSIQLGNTYWTYNGDEDEDINLTPSTIGSSDTLYPIMFYSTNSANWYRTSNATVSSSGIIEAKSFNAVSDRRLKDNLRDFKIKKSILDLPIYKFDYKYGLNDQIGCIAQDLQEICPEIVHEDVNGFLSIQESKIVYLLLEEVKKLNDNFQKLQKENEILKQKIEKLEG